MRSRIAFPATTLLILVTVSVLLPALPALNPDSIHLGRRLEKPSSSFILGTDELGRDLFSRIVKGSALSMKLTAVSLLLAVLLGGFFGGMAGYSGGAPDYFLRRFMDVLLALPGLLLAILIMAFFKKGEYSLIMALTATSWIGYARTSRMTAKVLKKAGFVESAVVSGAGPVTIWKKHIFRNILPVLMTQATAGAAGIIMTESGLSFLGLGISPPAPSIGGILSTGCDYLLESPHIVILASLYLLALLWSLYRISDGLQEMAGQ